MTKSPKEILSVLHESDVDPGKGEGLPARLEWLVRQAIRVSDSDLCACYSGGKLAAWFGRHSPGDALTGRGPLVEFLADCGEMAVVNGEPEGFLSQILLHPSMKSGAVLPVRGNGSTLLFFNSRKPDFFTGDRFYILESFLPLAADHLRLPGEGN